MYPQKAETYYLGMFVSQAVVSGVGIALLMTKSVTGSGCNIGKSPEWVLFSASTMFERHNNNN